MKKRLLSISSILFFYITPAQVVFCPPGAQWTNLFDIYLPFEQITSKIIYVGDSTIGAETYKVLQNTEFFTAGCLPNYGQLYKPYTLIKQRGDTIFMRNFFTQHNWQILYNFAAVPGDMWINCVGEPQTPSYYTTFVDSISFVTINNFLLKQLHVTVSYCGSGFNGVYNQISSTITERIGFGGHLFPYYRGPTNGACELIFFDGPLCYGDNAFGIKQFSEKGCFFTSMEENTLNPYHISFFPNPAQTTFLIKSDLSWYGEDAFLSFTDLHGRELKRMALNDEALHVNIEDMDDGIYFARIAKGNRFVYTTKLVKQE